MINRPWWLPEGLDPTGIQAWDAQSGCWFTGGSQESTFAHMNGPMFIWSRDMTNEEVMAVMEAIVQQDLAAILAMKPDHVGSGHDVDEDGTCHCIICQLKGAE